jgi:hypothetical protein
MNIARPRGNSVCGIQFRKMPKTARRLGMLSDGFVRLRPVARMERSVIRGRPCGWVRLIRIGPLRSIRATSAPRLRHKPLHRSFLLWPIGFLLWPIRRANLAGFWSSGFCRSAHRSISRLAACRIAAAVGLAGAHSRRAPRTGARARSFPALLMEQCCRGPLGFSGGQARPGGRRA